MQTFASTIRQDKGFTMIELIIGLAIAGFLSLAVSMAVYELFVVNASASNQTTVVRQVQNVGYWICRDSLGAQTIIEENDPDTPDFLILRWTDWSGVDYEAYYYFEGDELRRSYTVGENPPTYSTVAEHIDVEETTFIDSGAAWILTVKATVGDFPWPVSETRTYEVLPRPPSI